MNLEGKKAGKELEAPALTERIIAAAIAVHRELGPGFIESVYEEALALEFSAQGISFERQKVVPVFYRGRQVGEHRLDFFAANVAVLELKAAKALEDVHFAIVRSYMKACSAEIGLLLNFAAMPLTIRRVGRERSFYQHEASGPS
jgi:GxxExxY protein